MPHLFKVLNQSKSACVFPGWSHQHTFVCLRQKHWRVTDMMCGIFFFIIVINGAHLIYVACVVPNDCANNDVLTLCQFSVSVVI